MWSIKKRLIKHVNYFSQSSMAKQPVHIFDSTQQGSLAELLIYYITYYYNSLKIVSRTENGLQNKVEQYSCNSVFEKSLFML